MRGMLSEHLDLAEERPPRRRGRRPYFVERPIPREGPRQPPEPGDPAIDAAELLAAAGSLLSALRKPLREAGIDLRLARLLLTFPPNRAPLRIAQIAWRLGITTGAATRLVDRADAILLVDRHYGCTDRRGTWVQLTRKGWELRAVVDQRLRADLSTKRPAGRAFGIRYYLENERVVRRPARRRGSPAP
jgi:DNA-binding MarR family transcriptional regulator